MLALEIPFRLRRRILARFLAAGAAVSFVACAGKPLPDERALMIRNLDSLNQVAEHNDSVDANLFFYEEAFTAYKEKFPGVDKPAYMAVARGKDQAFCLFQPDPANTCLDVGNKFKALGLGEPARDAYEAGLLSEGVNGDTLNISLWSAMAQLYVYWGKPEMAKPYLTKVTEVDPKNDWARKMLAPPDLETLAAEEERKPAAPSRTVRNKPANRRGGKDKNRAGSAPRAGKYGMKAPDAPAREAAI